MPTFENSHSNNEQYKEQPNFRQNPDAIGACWKKRNDKGIEYLSMKIDIDGTTHNIKCFFNGDKVEGDKRPDFIVYKSKNIVKNKDINGNR